ncbi:PAQR family membrane homeostasis protein TrhA [Rhodocyclus tenuis]|uniref:Hemolysin III n=1 Tax=Rhodocyclus tenuis TaxID=1066 RepID=A0A840G3V4_RHOTE|nr:hemolysin III family protein [Rhodocyclus tenuis]MBB4249097.1 hemolysin III [Rhodocyclus tenuis]
MQDRLQSPAEELANSLSHGLGLLAALLFTPLLIVGVARHGDAGSIVGVSVFAATLILVYLSSALYHVFPPGRKKRLFEKLDQAAIFLFIAGSYTPFALSAIDESTDWAVFALVWGCATLGLLLKAFARLSHPLISSGCYLLLGWLVVVAALPLLPEASAASVAWLLAGAIAYSAGVAFYLTDTHVRFGHFVWHLFVLGGSSCHFLAVLLRTS